MVDIKFGGYLISLISAYAETIIEGDTSWRRIRDAMRNVYYLYVY